MEPKTETNDLIEHRKIKKKLSSNNQDNQVIAKLENDQKNMNIISHLKINPSMSSNPSIVLENSNSTLKDLTEKLDSIYSDLSPARLLDQNESMKINGIICNMSSNRNTKKTSYSHVENGIQENSLMHTNLTQFKVCEENGFVRCRFCHCIIDHDIQSEHATKCKSFKDPKSNYIQTFHCLICDKTMKSLKYWKSHAVNLGHIGKCMIKNNYVSYACGGCKTVFYGDKEHILNHCKNIHNDISKLPFIFKCMQEVFDQFIFLNPGNCKTWKYCGPCKTYSSTEITSCISNHSNKHLKYFNCNSCLIYFKCNQEVYNKHLMSCEHIMLEHLRTENGLKPESKNEYNLRLPPIFLDKFTINNKKATCNDCKFQMVSSEKPLTDHLIECIYKSDMNNKMKMKINTFFCAICNETTSDYHKWKLHVILPSHLTKCYDINDLISYTCEICSLHCYGNAYHVTEHQDIHPNNSEKNLSKFIAFNFQRINKDLKSKDYYYYCGDCETYAEVNIDSDHWNKSHKTKLNRKICKPCRTEFFCIEGNELFNKHILSSEHMILKYVATKASILEPLAKSKHLNILNDENNKPCDSNNTQKIIKKKAPLNNKLYLNWFQNVQDNKAACISCNDIVTVNEQALFHHLLICDQITSKIVPKININYYQCLQCTFKSNSYDIWKVHAISHVHLNTDYGLYSYLCTTCSSLLYGKYNDINLHLNEHKMCVLEMPLETVLMAKQFMRKNNNNITCKSPAILCLCEPCKKIFDLTENHNHFNTFGHVLVTSDLVELFYCEYCLVELYTSSKVIECHNLTAEHLILSSEYRNHDIAIPPESWKLDAHLLKYVIDQTLYNKTLNIGFFCFFCDSVCLGLHTWKCHLNSKKHINNSNTNCMDHRCKICKTLMFGTRRHMFEHYKNRFHSMLRQYKSITPENVLEKSTNNNDETHSMVKMMNEISLELNAKENNDSLEESTTNTNETCSMKEMIEEVPLKYNTPNFTNFFELKVKILNESIRQKQEVKPQIIYYCVSCDFISTEQKNWNHHNLTVHSNDIEVRHTIFCDICNLYQVGPFNNLDIHIKTTEHKYMEDFKKLYNSNDIKNENNEENLTSDEPLNVSKSSTSKQENNSDHLNVSKSSTSKQENNNDHLNVSKSSTSKQENNNDHKDEQKSNNRKVMIEIKGANSQYKENNWAELKKVLSIYGYFGSYSRQNSLIIIFRKLNSMGRFMKDKKKLEELHKIDINVVIEEDKMPDLNNTTRIEFRNKGILLQIINMQLMAIKQEISNSKIHHRLTMLINSIHRCSGQYFMYGKIYAFGSRMSGLALQDSDVDLYYDIANTFGGSLSNDLNAQEDLVRYFGKVFRSQKNDFKQIQPITGARVPIVKFYHCPSRLYCDLSFKSGLSTHNTKLVRLYLTLDERVHWMVCAIVKHWALQNELKNQNMFTSYALAWLVLFYLMTVNIVPPLKLLRDNAVYSNNTWRNEMPDEIYIEDWDCTFCTLEKAKQIWKVREVPCWDLLLGFFSFYADPKRLEQFVLCPAVGKAIPKESFFDTPLRTPDEFGFYKKRTSSLTQCCEKLKQNFFAEGLAVQDPFDLFHNITKTIVSRKLQHFSHLCSQTLEVMHNGIQPYYA